MSTHDRLDEGFELLKACSREQAPCNLDLEERMMKEFTNVNRSWMPRFSKMAVTVLLCVTVAGAAVAGTGGFSWLLENLNLTGTIDGQILDGEGNVIGTIELAGEAVVPDGEVATIGDVTIYLESEAGTVDLTD